MNFGSITAKLVVGLGVGMAWKIAEALYRRREKRHLGLELSQWETEGGNVPEVGTVTARESPEKS